MSTTDRHPAIGAIEAPASADELARFRDLQARFARSYQAIFSDPNAPRTVLIVPSLSLDRDVLAKITGVPENRVFTSSTGVIGERLPHDRITAKLDALKDALDPGALDLAARAIMTTDTRPKTNVVDAGPASTGGPAWRGSTCLSLIARALTIERLGIGLDSFHYEIARLQQSHALARTLAGELSAARRPP